MTKILSIKEDITKLDVDIIVNAANWTLMGGGGVDGAIHKAAGPSVLMECTKITEKYGNLSFGEAVLTSAGQLKANHIIHTVGPVYDKQTNVESQKLLYNSYWNSLSIGYNKNWEGVTIAFPNISTGVFGYPKEDAAKIALYATFKFVKEYTNVYDKVIFCNYDNENYKIYNELLNKIQK